MKWVNRYYQSRISKHLKPGKILVVYGPRRSGKTCLINRFLHDYNGKYYSGTGEDLVLKNIFKTSNIRQIKNAFSQYSLVFIDEAQNIPNIGQCLKIMVDHIKGLNIIASGSSSFQLSSKIGEPLTGRHKTILLYPLSLMEISKHYGGIDILESLDDLIVYGTYPEVVISDNFNEKVEYLISLRDSYLFKDILEFANIRNSDKLSDLLKLLAFQIGKEVSLNELGCSLGLAKQTIERYLDLLEKSFVIKKVRGFSRNLRKEVTKSSRYYFYDNGIRNSIINNFNPISMRDDVGMLWENFLFIERMKKLHYHNIYSNVYFWRTYDRKEIDLVEEREGRLFGYEFKWGKKKIKPIKLWLETYKNASFEVISKENFLWFLT